MFKLSNKSDKKVYILIPIFNGVKNTLKCLNSIYNSTYPFFEVVIIDDGSTDNSQELINEKYSTVNFVQGNGQLWWSGGINEGIRYVLEKKCSDEDIVVLLNNDNVVKYDMIERLVDSVNKYPDSIICSKVYLEGEESKVLFAGGFSSIKKSGLYIRGYYNSDSDEFDRRGRVEWCGGMGVAIPIHIIRNVGYFDDNNFPQYFGDADYMYQARKKGYQIIYDPASICWNNKEQTGFSLKDGRVNLLQLKYLFFNIKSNYDLKRNFKFYFKTFGPIRGASMVSVKYIILILSLFKKMLLKF